MAEEAADQSDAPLEGKPEPKNPLPDDPAVLRAELEKVRKEAANYRTKAKELEPLAQRLKEFEDRDKSEGEKFTERLSAAEKRAEAAEQKALRLEVAASKGLSPTQAKRLVGATREELEADADEIIEAFPARSAASPPPSTKPSPSARGGTDPTEAPEPDVQKLVDSIPRV